MNKKAIILLIASVFILPSFVFADTINGTWFDDVLHGTENADVIHGWSGADVIYGHGGNDVIYGDWGPDVIFGGDGDDRIYGGLGIDVCSGGAGYNHIEGCETLDSSDQTSTSDVNIVQVDENTQKIVGGIGTTVVVFPEGLEASKSSAYAIEEGSITNPLSGKEIELENTDNIVIE